MDSTTTQANISINLIITKQDQFFIFFYKNGKLIFGIKISNKLVFIDANFGGANILFPSQEQDEIPMLKRLVNST